MIENRPNLSPEVIDLARRGNPIAAIKLAREQTGLGLKEAKETIEYSLRNPTLDSGISQPNEHHIPKVPLEAVVALQKGALIEAIKHTRAKTGLGLKESKQLVEQFLEENPLTKTQFQAASAVSSKKIPRPLLILLTLAILALLVLSFTGLKLY